MCVRVCMRVVCCIAAETSLKFVEKEGFNFPPCLHNDENVLRRKSEVCVCV